jgi:acetolactate synthase-1/3 small subunit
MTFEGPHVERELALVKVVCKNESRSESLKVAEIFRARVVDSTSQSFVFEISGQSSKIDAFVELLRPLGLVDISRTGVVAILRGATSLEDAS